MKKQQYSVGLQGEEMAEAYLQQQGMVCIARRYRAGRGEIDLIMRDQQMLVFVEVKARPLDARGSGLAAVSKAKRERLISAAQAFLVSGDVPDGPVRFDIVQISREGILWVPNAFGAET